MCWMCEEFGDAKFGNGLWYLNPYNYARNMYKLREPGAGFAGADAGLETRARERRAGPTQADLMKAVEEGNAEEAARILPILQERVKTGTQPSQVVPLRDADKVLEAQEELTNARFKVEKVNNFKPAPLQEEETSVQIQQTAPQASYDQKAESWRQDNPWFGTDEEMTAFALGLHQKLVKSGVDPQSDEYYARINSRMRQVFPDSFEEAEEQETKHIRCSNVVAPATRSVAPKKITLTKTQVALAKKLGVPLTEYAKQVAEEMRKNHG